MSDLETGERKRERVTTDVMVNCGMERLLMVW